MYEYTTLQRLYQVGAAVPQPLAASENAILMSYVGDEVVAASALVEMSDAVRNTQYDSTNVILGTG